MDRRLFLYPPPPTWEIVTNSDGTSYVRTAASETAYTTTLSMSFTSEYNVDLNYSIYYHNFYDGDSFKVVVDGVEESVGYSYWESVHKIIPKGTGTHKIDFVYTSAAKSSDSYFAAIRDVNLIEYKPLETACLKQGSIPITFQNDPEHPWLTKDGYIQSMTADLDNITSTIATTFTVDKPSLFSYESLNNNDYGNRTTTVKIDGEEYYGSISQRGWWCGFVVLYPGEHTIEFEDYHEYSSSEYNSRIRNVCLHQDWYDVILDQPGQLAVKIVQALGDKNLQDAELVKITGSMNEDDWATVSQLTGIKAIDFTGTDITSIPANALNGKSYLSTLMLPETLKEIGNEAFVGTNFYEITIPGSVEKIGSRAWYETPLRYITFAENSKLMQIGTEAFSGTRLIEFIMPDTVTDIPYFYDGRTYHYGSVFSHCTSLRKLHLSDGLSSIPIYMAYYCTNLQEVHLPVNATCIDSYAFENAGIKTIDIPEAVTSIGVDAFQGADLESVTIPRNVSSYGGNCFGSCKKLKEVTLNSHCWNLNGIFSYCTALETVVLPCATPPSIESDPFYGVTKANVKLIVPDFAYNTYRVDSYWYNFTNIQAGDAASLNDYWAIRGNLTLDKEHVMQGTPSIEIIEGGVLTMDTDVPQGFNEFTYNNSESAPASYLSNSNSVTATKLNTNFYVSEADKWFFFSPVCDVNMSDVSYPATDSWVIRYYDGARRASNNDNSGNWVNVPADGKLLRGQGYIIQAAAAGWLNMPAAADRHNNFFGSNEVTHTLADNACETAANAGWNFVSNPYPCYYDIYYFDMQAPITVWNGSTYRAYSLNDGDRGDDTFVLRPMQPFFVQKASADITCRMPLTGRRTSSVIDRTRSVSGRADVPSRATSANQAVRHLLNLELLSANNVEADDYSRIVINEEASMAYEPTCDASKFMSLDNKVAQIYSLGEGNHPMAINERPYDSGTVALGVYLPKAGETYCIAATRCDRRAWLYDAETGIEHDLTAANYVFTASNSGVDTARFSIRFKPATSGVENVDEEGIKVIGSEGSISVTAPEGAIVAVYATDGTTIATAASSAEIPVPAGVYVVKVNGETFKTIVK